MNMYKRCRCRQISTDVMNMLWHLFGHILRMVDEAANRVNLFNVNYKMVFLIERLYLLLLQPIK